jgi:hypothetical protein
MLQTNLIFLYINPEIKTTELAQVWQITIFKPVNQPGMTT